MAKLYAVGVGPGDPELLTRKAERVIRGADVVCAPTATPSDASYALSIVEQFLDRERQEVLVSVFPMRKEQQGLAGFWEETARELAERVRRGMDVAFITIGDPFLYSTFLYLHRIVRELYPDVAVEVVPGVSSIGAAAAAAGVPLALAEERVAILPATFEDDRLRDALLQFDTVVLLKVNRVFERVYRLLQELGLEKSGVFVRRVGSPQEEVVFDLPSLLGRELDYLSLLIVRKSL